MRLTHDLGRSLELADTTTGSVRWRYVYGGKPKPFFHPLCTPAGHLLSSFEPSDHLWHRGLWFTIKFVNGENFWEERPPFGTQRTTTPPATSHAANGAITIASQQTWHRPYDAGVVIDEQRTIVHRELDAGSYALDFATTLTPRADVLLDRTPFTTWGGYGGLVFRAHRGWQKGRLLFADGTVSERPTPVHGKWVDLSGLLDGGDQVSGGVAIFDHPRNVRHPTPWYGGTQGTNYYVNAAFLFNEPLSVRAGEPLALRYRVIVHDGSWERDRLESQYQAWLGSAAV
jgi:hypothetical protein